MIKSFYRKLADLGALAYDSLPDKRPKIDQVIQIIKGQSLAVLREQSTLFDNEDLLAKILEYLPFEEAPELSRVNRAWNQAFKKTNDLPQVLARLSQSMVNETTYLGKAGYESTRIQAARALGYLGDPSILPLLKTISKGSEKSSSILQASALIARARLNDSTAVDGLLNLVHNSSFSTSIGSSYALRLLKDESVIPVLKKKLNESRYSFCLDTSWFRLAEVLGHFKNEEGINFLKEAMTSKDFDRKYEAAVTLGHLGNQEAKETLKQCMFNSSLAHCERFEAAEALEELGDPSAKNFFIDFLKKLVASEISLDVDPKARNSYYWIRRYEALRRFAPKRVANSQELNLVNFLNEAVENTKKDPSLKIIAAEALGHLKVQNGNTFLKKTMFATSGVNKELKIQALGALGRLQDRSILGPLKACIRDSYKLDLQIYPFEGSFRDINFEKRVYDYSNHSRSNILGLIGTFFN